MEGIKKIIKEKDENGNETEVEVTEYPDVPVILVENNEELSEGVSNDNGTSDDIA